MLCRLCALCRVVKHDRPAADAKCPNGTINKGTHSCACQSGFVGGGKWVLGLQYPECRGSVTCSLSFPSVYTSSSSGNTNQGKKCSSSSTCLDGPYNKYAFSWYMGTQGSTCDQVCSGVGGKNLYDKATNAFKDYCGMSKDRGKDSDDVMYYFYKNGNKGKFKGSLSSGTSYKTLGYGYVGSTAYGKCAVGNSKGAGTIPAEASNSKTRINVCACFGAPDRPA